MVIFYIFLLISSVKIIGAHDISRQEVTLLVVPLFVLLAFYIKRDRCFHTWGEWSSNGGHIFSRLCKRCWKWQTTHEVLENIDTFVINQHRDSLIDRLIPGFIHSSTADKWTSCEDQTLIPEYDEIRFTFPVLSNRKNGQKNLTSRMVTITGKVRGENGAGLYSCEEDSRICFFIPKNFESELSEGEYVPIKIKNSNLLVTESIKLKEFRQLRKAGKAERLLWEDEDHRQNIIDGFIKISLLKRDLYGMSYGVGCKI